MESPVDALLDFAEQLPTTVKQVILARCCMAFGRLQPDVQQDLFATFRAIVVSAEAGQAAYVCAQMAAVLELTLCSPEAPLPREWYRAAADQRLDRIDLDSALAQKHWRAAQDEFARLRNTLLHPQSLRMMMILESTRETTSTGCRGCDRDDPE
jgi:hypothetical protein